MAESISDFIRKQAQQQQLNTVGAASIVLDTVEQKPDEVAGALHLADEYASETGGPRPPVEFVQEYGNVLRKEIERKRTGTILSGAPKLADWVRDPVNAALAKDAIKELSWFEGFTKGTANTAERAGERLDIGYNQFMLEQTAGRARDREMSFSDILKEERTSTRFTDEQGNPIETWDGSEYISAFARWVDARYADLIGTDDKAAAEEYARALNEARERLQAIPKSQVATEFEQDAMVEGASLGDALVNFGAAFIRNPVGGLAWALETAGESAPQIVAGAVTTAVTRNPTAGIAVAGTGSYLTERYTSPAEFFEEKGLDLSKPEDIQRLISDPALMKEAAERGVVRGLVIGAFDALSMGVAGRSLAGNPLVEAMAQTAQQMVLGAGGEYTARLAAGQEIDWNEVIAEGFAEGATAVVDMGIAGRKLIRQRREASEAVETQKKVEELLANAGQNPLRARMPAKFQEFLERATAGTNVESVFVDSQKFVEFFQGMGVDPFEIADTLEGVGAEELRMATLSGGDVKIPVATLATTVPGSGFEEFFIQEARFDPDTMSPSQAAEFNARVDELRAEAFEMAEQLRQEEERARTREQEIYETIVSELRAAGQSNNVATNAAMVWLANYRTAAADEGVTLDEYLERYPLPTVRGARPEGIIPKNVDELTRTLAEARTRKKTGQIKRGPSLLEFISEYGGIDDAGGELRARNAEIVKRGKGKKSLRLARGGLTAVKDMLGAKAAGKKFGPDDVARAVIEAGYLSDDPVVQEYRAAMEEGREVPDITRALWEGIDRELRGEALYAASSEPDADVVAREEMLDNLEQYLSELGVSLDDPDDVIREAVNRDMEERRAYASGALEQSIRGGFDMSAGGGVKTVKVGDTTLMYSIASDGKSAELFSVRTPASKRGKGSARFAIASFLLETDALGMEVKLSASPLDKKTKLGQLVEFYKSLGFEPTGRTINVAGDPEMVRKPQRSYNQQGRLNTESEAFKRWFGNSKVVDDQGEPLVVYHGTAASFEEFDLGAASRTGHPSSGLGVFFTASPNVASMFAREWDDAAPFDTADKRPFAEGASTMPVYLSIKNPITLSDREFRDLFVDRETYRLRDIEAFRKLREEYKAQGYDGVIIEASGEAVPSPGLEEYTARQFIAFEPTQIKSVYNRGTFDPNDPRILFQSGDAPNLIVQHNLTAANLLHADRMRGLAVPSVAISNVNYPLDGFGEITLLGGPDMVDPRKDRATKVFDADVYSPRYPTVHYKLAKPAFKKAWKRLEKASSELGHVLSSEIDEGEVTRNGLSAFRDSMAVQLAFLRETGRDIVLPQQTARTNYLDLVPELANMTVDAYGVNNEPELREAVERAINLSIAKTIDAVPGLDADELRSQYYTRDGEIRRSVIDDIQREKHVRRYPGVDRSAARYALREAVQPHAAEFAEWVENNFGDVVAGEVIQTETASGDWKYLPHTLDNVVKVLKKGLRDGEGFNYGVGSIRSTVANQFKSISAIQKARGRLIPSDAMQAVKDEVDDEFVALAGKVGEFSEYSGGLDWLNTFSEQLKDVAARGVGVLDQYFDGLPDELKQEVSDFLNKLANLPSEYFEAKIQRAVDLSEFKAAVIPSDTPEAARNVLMYARVPVFEYDPDVEGSRAEAIRRASTENRLLFQSAPPAENDAFKRWFEGSQVVDEAGNPKVVYHGTFSNFEAFDLKRSQGFNRLGFWFDTSPETPNAFAAGTGGNVMPVYLSIKNPLVVTGERAFDWQNEEIVNLWTRYGELTQQAKTTTSTSEADELRREARGVLGQIEAKKKEIGFDAFDKLMMNLPGGLKAKDEDVDAFVERLKAEGYDGIVLKGTRADDGSRGGKTTDWWIALDPSQIKSVNNRGTFDPGDARILYQPEGGAAAGGEALQRDLVQWARRVDGIVSGSYDHGNMARIGRVSAPFRALGMRGSSIEILAGKLAKIIREHRELPLDTIKRLPELLADPIAILPSGYKDGSKVAVLDALDKNGNPVIAAILPKSGENSVLLSVYGKDAGWKWVADQISNAFEHNEKVYLRDGLRGVASPSEGEAPSNAGLGTYYGLIPVQPPRKAAGLVVDKASLVNTYGRGFYQSDTGARGSILFPSGGLRSGETIINLFERADMSTFLHESGHYFLENLRDRASLGSEVAQERMAVIRNWWRENARAVAADAKRASGLDVSEADVISWLDNGTTGNGDKDMAVDTGAHEQWARGFEAYLMEGKAPSVELRSAFERFAAWLRWLYKSIAGLNVKINDDIRAVFDRMLAAEAEIAKAREVSGGDAALFASAAEMGVSEDEFRAYVRLREQADEEAKARLQREIMEPIKREQERWYKEEREKVRSEVEREINAWGQYRAIEWMGNRRWLGEGQPQALPDMRLSKDILVDRYGEGILKTLPRGKQTIYAVEGGLDPDDAAAWFGFESGDEMIRAMETAPKRTDAIEAETDRRMRELHGDPLHDGSVEEEAIAALHNDKRGQWIAAELEAVRKTLDNAERLSMKQAREVAKKTIAGMKVRDAMNWRRFLAAERKAAEEAADLGARLSSERYWENRAKFAKKDEAGAPVRPAGQNDMVARLYMAKRRQLLNHALYAESVRVAEEVAKAERFVSKLQGKKHREKIAGAGRRENAQIDYLAAIDEILQRYDFRKMSARAEDRRGALSAYVEAMRAAGRENELAIPQVVLEPGGALSRATRHEKAMRDAGRIPYKSVPVEELRGVIDALKNIEHTALRWNEFIVNQKKREFNEAADTIARSIIENVGSKPASWIKESGLGAMAKRGVSAYLATVQSATYIMRKLDGRDDFGPVYELLKSDLDAAAYRELTLQRETAEKLRSLFAMYSEDEQRQMAVSKVRPELGGRSFSKWNLIAMALNMGNEGNLARLTNERARFHLKPHEVEAVKSMLDERDARFVQGVWDLISSFRPEIAKRDRRVKGVEPEWVEPTPVTIGGVELRGGYYPIKYDPRHGGGRPSAAAGDDDILQSIMGGGYSSAHTKDGHLKARGTNVNQSLLLDVSVIPRHLNEVIHDLTHSEAVVNTWKLLTDGRVERAFLDAGLDHAYQQLKLWVQDAATGQVGSGSVLAQALTFLRGGFAYSKLAFSVKTILMQPLGVMQSSVAVGKGRMARNMLRMIQHPVAYSNEVLEKSAMMRMRRDTFNKDLMDAAAQANIASPAGNRVKAFWDQYIIPLGMAGMVYTQFYTVDLPTWGAAYEKGMKQFGGDVEKSIQYADMTVQRSQGSGIWTDRTAIERGTLSGSIRQNPFVTLLTTLGSYFFAKANMAFESYDQFRAEGVTLHSSMRFGMDMGLLFLGEAIVVELVKELWDEAFGDGDDDEDDGSFISNVLTEGVKTAVAGLPVIRDAAGVIQGFDAGTYAAILKVFTSPAYQASQGEVDAAFVKSVINLAGMVGRMPSAQINRIVDASWRQAEGEDVSPMEYIMGRSR